MGDSWQKGSKNDTDEPGSIGGFQYFQIKDNKGLMDALAKLYENPLVSNKVFLMKRLFNMKMSKVGML
jgi:hypothetical protein